MSTPPPTTSTSDTNALAAAHITALLSIDSSITSLLQTTSDTLALLAAPAPSAADFQRLAADYHAQLSSIAARMRREIAALQNEEVVVGVEVVGAGAGAGSGGRVEGGAWRSARGVVGALAAQEEEGGDVMME